MDLVQLAVLEIVCSTWWRLSKREYEEKDEITRDLYPVHTNA